MDTPPVDTARWPGSPYDLVDTAKCPACFAPITVTASGAAPSSCTTCGLPLTDARLGTVLELGQNLLSLELTRRATIGAIRATHEARLTAAAERFARTAERRAEINASSPRQEVDRRGLPAPTQHPQGTAPVVPTPAAAPVSRPQPQRQAPVGGSAPIAPLSAPPLPPTAPRRARPRITVPVLLLIVGVSLVGIAAIFFLTLAWFVADIAVRALIIGAITLATLVVASLLRRRDLTATAEAIAVIGILLVGLDAWAVRANGLLGADAMEGSTYAGLATLAVAVVCRIWARLSHLRAPDLASVIALPAGLGLLIGGLTAPSAGDAGPAWVWGLVGAAVGGLTFALPAPWSAARDESEGERTTLSAIGLAALITATGLSFFVASRDIAFVLWAVPLLVIVAAAWWVALARRAARIRLDWAPTFATIVACAGVAAASTLGWQLALRSDSSWFALVLGPVIAVAVAVAVDLTRTRAGLPAAAFATAAAIASAGLLLAVTLWMRMAVTTITAGWMPWRTDPVTGSWRTDPVALALALGASPDAFLPLAAAVVVVALLWVAPALRRPPARALRTTASAVLVLVAAASTARPVIVVGVALAVAAGSVVVARIESRRADADAVLPSAPSALGAPDARSASGAPGTIAVWAAPAALSAATAYAAGTATTWLWVIAALVTIALPVVLARTITAAGRGTDVLQATSTVFAIGLAAVSAFVAPQAIAAAVGTDSGAGLAGFALLQWVALVSIGLALWAAPGVVRRTLAISGVALAAASLIPTILAAIPEDAGLVSSGSVSVAIGEPWTALIRGAALVAALGAVAWARIRGGFPTGVAATAAVLLAPSVGAVIVAITDLAAIPDATPPLATGAFALLCLGSALAALRAPRTDTVRAAAVRAAADTGALVATTLVAWQSRSDLAWLVLLLIGGALAAMSVTRGWAAPRAATLAGVVTASSDGVPFAAARRRALVWAAFAFGVAALWAAVAESRLFGDRPTLEAYTVAPAAGLVALTIVLTWLRRHAEATLAATLAAVIGVVVPASMALLPYQPARPIIATAVAAALCAALAWTPARRLPGVSVAAAITTLAGAAIGAVLMAQWAPVAHSAWAIVPVAAAFLAAIGFESGAAPSTARRPSPGQHRFAAAAPPVALVLAAAAVANVMLVRDAWWVGALAIALLLVLSLAAAAVDRAPIGAATRWAATGGAALIAAALLQRGAVIELVTLPIATAVLGGAALAMRRLARRGAAWPGVETMPWLAGVVVAVAPSLLAEPLPGRLWLLVSACLLVAVGLAAVSPAQTMALTASTIAIAAAGALIAGLRAALELAAPHGFAIALVAGAGTAGVGAVTVWRRVPPPALARTAAAAGAALVAFAVAVCGDGSVTQTVIVVAIATAAALGAAIALSRPGWLPVAGILTLGGVVVALVAVVARLARMTPTSTGGAEPDAWVLAVALIVAAIGAVALRVSSRAGAGTAPAIRAVVEAAVGAAFAVTVILVALAQSWLLWSGGYDARPARAAVTILLLTAAAVAGALLHRRIGAALGIAAWVAVGVVAVVAVFTGGARPFEVVTFAPALGLLVLGIRRLRLEASVRSWPALGPGLALATIPSLLHDFGPNDLWRIVALGVVAVALVVIGATRRLQAPLILGTVVLLVHAVAQLWPWIAGAYDAVPWWLWVGLGGVLLIVIAARYERQLKALRTAYAAVAGLR